MSHRADFFVAAQRILPKHALSRMIGRVAESKRTWLKNILIKRAIAAFRDGERLGWGWSLDFVLLNQFPKKSEANVLPVSIYLYHFYHHV